MTLIMFSSYTVSYQANQEEDCVFGNITQLNVTTIEGEKFESFKPVRHKLFDDIGIFCILIIVYFSFGFLKEAYKTITCN